MDIRVERLLKWHQGDIPGPVRIDLNPTNLCNLHCRSCWMRAYPHIDHSTQTPGKRLIELIREGAALDVREWEITGGGEPLAAFDTTVSLIRNIKSFGMYGSMTTNGTLFTESLIQEMVAIGWDKIVFSLDGHTDAIDDYLRGAKGAFARKMNALTLFQTCKSRLKKQAPLIQFNTVLSTGNARYLPEFIDLAARVGAEIVCFEPITIHSPEGEALTLSESDREVLPEAIELALERAAKTGVWTNAAQYREERLITNSNTMDVVISKEGADYLDIPLLRTPCYEPWYHLVIKTDGAVGPCCIFNSAQADSIKTNRLADVWYGQFLTSIRQSLLKGRLQRFCAICNAGQVAQNRWLRDELARVLRTVPNG